MTATKGDNTMMIDGRLECANGLTRFDGSRFGLRPIQTELERTGRK